MAEQKIMITNRAGVHARPAAQLVRSANRCQADVYLEKDGERVNAKSIMGIIALGAGYRSSLRVIATGKDEVEAVHAIVRLIESKFQVEEET